MVNLEKANRLRLRRTDLRHWVREPVRKDDALDRLAELLRGDRVEEALGTQEVLPFLLWVRRMFRLRAVRFLQHPDVRLRENTTLGSITDRQRALVVRFLETEARKYRKNVSRASSAP